MKKTLATLALILVAGTAQANEVNCENVGKVAELIMELRQSEMPMSKLKNQPSFNEAVKKMVIEAYSVRSYASREYRIKAAKQFRNKYEMACYRAK